MPVLAWRGRRGFVNAYYLLRVFLSYYIICMCSSNAVIRSLLQNIHLYKCKFLISSLLYSFR